MHRWRSLTALTAAALLSLTAACSSGDSTQDTGSKVQEVTFWSFLRGSDTVAAAFNASHPGIKVKFVTMPASTTDYYNKLSNAIKSGDVPDVAVSEYTRLPEIVSLGGATDLSDQAGSLVDKDFPGSIQDLVQLGGKTWAVPRDASPMLYFYRKDFFEKNHLTVPTTWADYAKLAAKVKSVDSGKRAGAYLTNNYNLLTSMAWQAGGSWFGTQGDSWTIGIDDAASLKVASYWQGLVDDDLVSTLPDYIDQFWTDVQKGSLVGYFCASYCAGNLKATVPDESGDWAVAQLPSWDGTPASSMWGGSSFIVPKGAKNSAAALEFIKWITTDADGVKAWYANDATSMYPARKSLVTTAKSRFTTDYFGGQDIFSVLTDSYDSVVPGWRWGPTMATTETAFDDRLGKVAGGSADLTDVFKQVEDATVKATRDRGLTVAK
ncbi:extracellular solute-binding protein [Streptomyces sp. NPDC001833]|uniref:ABC transporter substrate-binding protein n=1 Tax=Streptomyces sp. NPDC001833 TaxID=3154658 RepID=UPI003323559C